MFTDYENLVLEDYQRKKSQNALSSQLIHPTPARIKKECVRLCGDKLQRKDEKVIRDFCEEWDNTKTYLQNIENCDVDKFRPLLKFLKGDTENTDPKNIHLLAWLIDFRYRPFEFDKNYTSLTDLHPGVEIQEQVAGTAVDTSSWRESETAEDVEEEDTGGVQDSQPQTDPVKRKRKFPKLAVIGVLLAVIGTAGYWWWNAKQPQGNGGCMYWTGDHFQPIPCDQKVPNTLVVALDTTRVKNFKKITRPDTITYWAIGHVWYSKIDNNIEFFTADGRHPVFVSRRLKPVTEYIIDKHIHPGITTNK